MLVNPECFCFFTGLLQSYYIIFAFLQIFQNKLNKALKEPVEALLETAGDDTWPAIRKLLNKETKVAVSGLESDLAGFELDRATVDELLSKLEKYARSVVENKAREEASRVVIRMKDRYFSLSPFLMTSPIYILFPGNYGKNISYN